MTLYICGFHPFKETESGNASRYCKELMARHLKNQKKKHLPTNLSKGEFVLVSISSGGVDVAIYKFSDAAACREVSSS